MKRKATALTLILALLVSMVAGALLVNMAKANGFPLTYLPEITIKGDGSITPETGFINRNGNIFTLTANVEGYGLVIECNSIVLDGAGHSINTTMGDTSALHLRNAADVTIKNLEAFSRYTCIYLYYSSNCLLTGVKANNRIYLTDGSNFNTITKSTVGHLSIGSVGNANNNLIVKNNVTQELWVGGSGNRFSQNNFLLKDFSGITSDNFWDNGSIGNYWGNYSIKYPNASEIGNTGIGDTPYVIEREWWTAREYPDATDIDRYPLMYPYDIEKDTIAFPAPEPQPESEPFPVIPVATASVATIVVVGAVLLVYFKKRKH